MLTELDLALYLAVLASPAVDPRALARAVAAVGAGAPSLAVALASEGIADAVLQALRVEAVDEQDATVEVGMPTFVDTGSEGGGGEAGLQGYAVLGLSPARFARRFQAGVELGRGGVGRVVEAHDQLVGRTVALKTLHAGGSNASALRRFVAEARTTAQLEHPNVVPVYDFGVLPDGTPCFAMKRVRGRSLKAVLAGLLAGDADCQAAFSPYRLLRILIGVGQAVDYAHSHGVVHRDLKPDNIMVGDFGEVLVMDWGVAKVLRRGPEASDSVVTLTDDVTGGTLAGSIVGTPGYMPPEQARGEHDRIDGRADVWALGAILYEILTGQRPFQGENSTLAVLVATSSRDVPPASSVDPRRQVPADLEEICTRALAREPAQRYPSARALCDDVELYLTGTRERDRRQAEADRLVAEAEESLWYLGMLRDELADVQARLAEQPPLTGQEPIAQKRVYWAAEDRCEALDREQRQAFGWAEGKLIQAVEQSPGHERARSLLADMHWRRYRHARGEHAPEAAEEHLKAVARYRPADPRLRQPVVLTLHAQPAGAEVLLSRVVEQDRVLVSTAERSLGHAPLVEVPIPTGRSTLEVRVPGRRPVFIPVMAWQGDTLSLEVDVPTEAALGPDFAFVPGGHYVRGTDPEAILARPSGLVHVPAFAIGRFPVTCGEYFEFLNDLPREDALRHAPRAPGQGVIVPPGPSGWAAPALDVDGDVWDPRWPVFNVSYEDAEAYAAWRSAREGVAYRLPTEDEWEKAARGADGRVFPWGDHFDPTFCRMRTSAAGDLLPRPVGEYPTDRSPYGVHDMAGGVREWVDGWLEKGLRSARGGAFNHYAFLCRAASRFGYSPRTAIAGLGFRLVKALPPG